MAVQFWSKRWKNDIYTYIRLVLKYDAKISSQNKVISVNKPTLRVRGARVGEHRLARRQAAKTDRRGVTGKQIRD
jgi:hypothetical protein